MKTDTAFSVPTVSPAMPVALPEEDEGGLNLGALLQTLQRKWWLILGATVATTALAGAKVLTDTPVYNGQFEILVQSQSTEAEVLSDVDDAPANQRQEEKVDGDLLKLLKSPTVLQPVIDGIRDRSPSFCPSGTSSATNYDPCYRQLAGSLSVGIAGKDSQIIQASFQALEPETVTAILDLVSQAYLEYSLASKQADIRLGMEFVEQKLPDLRAKVNTLQGELQSLRLENDLIDPDSRGSQLSGQVSSFSQEQLEVQSQLRQARALYAELQEQSGTPQEQASSSAFNENPRYQALLDSLLELDAQISEASTLYLDSSPDMEVLLEERENLLLLLEQQGEQSQREVLNQIRELESREQSISQTLQELNAGVDELSGITRNYTDIERELQIATNNLNQFLSKREALQIEAAQREIPWEIVTPPTPPAAQPESLPQNLLLSGMLGLILGTGLALLLDKTAGVVYDDEVLRRTTRLPILARIPKIETLNGQNIQENYSEILEVVSSGAAVGGSQNGNGSSPRWRSGGSSGGRKSAYGSDPFSESFRLLLTNLRRANLGNSLQSVAVSSATAGEGKSTVAIYLAEAAAAMGQRVLLVDADLRNPQIHQYLELSNEKGLTTLYAEERNPSIIQKLSTQSNMYVICAGPHMLEPARILSSRSMSHLIDRLRPLFDFIIFDTPPLLGQSDAYLIANQMDGLLLVAQSGKLKQSQLDRAMEQLRLASINVLGVVSREQD
ncbi:MAG: polysaccharide biosynthesis tyrosine autokinase [Cyanobacteria bacterium J06627_28]